MIYRLDLPFERFDLVLAGLNRETDDIVGFTERAELGESDSFVGARPIIYVESGRVIP
jgi:hypothetical protein